MTKNLNMQKILEINFLLTPGRIIKLVSKLVSKL